MNKLYILIVLVQTLQTVQLKKYTDSKLSNINRIRLIIFKITYTNPKIKFVIKFS